MRRGVLTIAFLGCAACSDDSKRDASDGGLVVADAAVDASDGALPADTCDIDGALCIWPNQVSRANSDPWIMEHHDRLDRMQPRILAINFTNGGSMASMHSLLTQVIAGFREGSRYHGYSDPDAPAFLDYQLAYEIDLRDQPPANDWLFVNSTSYPRRPDPSGEEVSKLDYGELFTQAFADKLKIADPASPGHNLTLCELVDRGLVHEVWLFAHQWSGDQIRDAVPYEVVGIQPFYSESFERLPGPLNTCAGQSCLDAEDVVPETCTRSLRIGFVNEEVPAGNYLHSMGHVFEGLYTNPSVPYVARYFREFAGFDFDDRYGVTFPSWYDVCPLNMVSTSCLSYPTAVSVTYDGEMHTGTFNGYRPVCGNVHFPPNARGAYDYGNTTVVDSSCTTYRQSGNPRTDETTQISADDWARYSAWKGANGGDFLVWWYQNMPGRKNLSLDDDQRPMKSWFPFLFY